MEALEIATPVAPQPKRRRALSTVLRLAVSIALIAWLLRRTDFREVLAAFRSADPRLIVAAALLIPLGYLCSVFRWRALLRSQGGDAPLSFLIRSLMTGIFFNNLLPSTIGGDAIRAWDTSRAGVSRATAVTIVVVDRFVGLLALVLFAAVGLLISGRLTERVPDLYGWVLGGTAVMALIAALLFLPSRRAPDLLAKLGRSLPGRWGALPGKIGAALFAFQGKGRVLATAFAWSIGLQALVVLNVWTLARALHVPIPLPYFFLIMPVALFAMMLPVSINGIGVRENAYAFFFAAFGVTAAAGVAVAWLDYALLLLQALAGGAVYAWGRRSPDPSALSSQPFSLSRSRGRAGEGVS
ncbi:MAG TPA: lysylphosphatidylglycerol synthase transmembrane domain-containing protein [Thermoanaerobaculia bacterium]